MTSYFEWLYDMVSPPFYDIYKSDTYYILLGELYKKPFKVLIERDKNRISDAEDLYQIYCDECEFSKPYKKPENIYKIQDPNIVKDHSILEVLIGLSKRMEFIMTDESGEDYSYRRWFWELLKNMGLLKFTDDNWYDSRMYDIDSNTYVNNRLDRFNNRNFDRYCHGGPFPMHNPKRGYKKMELWYQMMEYLQEKYNVEED